MKVKSEKPELPNPHRRKFLRNMVHLAPEALAATIGGTFLGSEINKRKEILEVVAELKDRMAELEETQKDTTRLVTRLGDVISRAIRVLEANGPDSPGDALEVLRGGLDGLTQRPKSSKPDRIGSPGTRYT